MMYRSTDFFRCDQSSQWKELQNKAQIIRSQGFDLVDAFNQNTERFAQYSQQVPHLFVDFSKNYLDDSIETALLAIAHDCQLDKRRQAMFSGQVINNTERRMVGHTWLRSPDLSTSINMFTPSSASALEAMQSVFPARETMLTFAEMVRADDTITDVVNIGIGGSDLGPRMMLQALSTYATPAKHFHFVSNIDGEELLQVLAKLRPDSTLFIIASKSFTTLEPLLNAQAAKQWFLDQGGEDIHRHFCAVSSNIPLANAFGIRDIFVFGDWVGGRYSIWSSIGLIVAISVGATKFKAILDGAHAMDMHFLTAPHEQNLPIRLGLLDVWYRLLGQQSRCITPYHSALQRLPSYLQQLEMESNGKGVDCLGHPLTYDTAPILWGEVGTCAQHAYFQLLHQGTLKIPVELIAIKSVSHALVDHHKALLANAIGQAQALLLGRYAPNGYQHFKGNRPSTFVLMDALNPASMGALIALYEHRVFVSGTIWGINSFDQFGVQLGKILATDIESHMDQRDFNGLDASTAGLLSKLISKDDLKI